MLDAILFILNRLLDIENELLEFDSPTWRDSKREKIRGLYDPIIRRLEAEIQRGENAKCQTGEFPTGADARS